MLANASRQVLRATAVRSMQSARVATVPLTRSISTNAPLKDTPLHDMPKDTRLHAMKAAAKEADPRESMVVFRDVSVQQILDHKAAGQVAAVATVSRGDTVYEAIKKMNAVRVGALVVIEDGSPVGMISERDYLNKVILRGFSSKEIKVNDIMTSDIVTVTSDVSAGDCMELMTQGRFRHIPVVDPANKMLGIVSIGDLVKTVLDQQKETINYLKEYIERTY